MSKTVQEEYAELTHYTSAAGLTGIVNSGCLWATHAKFLNDATEITHFFDARLTQVISSVVGKSRKISVSVNDIVRQFRAIMLDFHQPYIFSMSATKDHYIADHGLLSQWRGYGEEGGYALVFDTDKLGGLLKNEGESFGYNVLKWGDVFYYGIDPSLQSSSRDIIEMEDVIAKAVEKKLETGAWHESNGLYDAISSLSCLYKHKGFYEEREVRVVCIPATKEVLAVLENAGERVQEKVPKSYIRKGAPVPYIELFSQNAELPKLPIKRVIVGPHKDRKLRMEAVTMLLLANGYNVGQDVKVTHSDIPYVGR